VPSQTITAADALSEYLDTHGLKRVSKRLISSGVIDVVATAAPGIDDIVVLGKIKQLERSGNWDVVLVDGPAAGHAISMLRAAKSVLATVRGGPLRVQAHEVAAMLADPTRTQVVLVTLPETTPINELIETAYALEDQIGVHLAPVVVNVVDAGEELDEDAAPDGSAMRTAAAFRNARRRLQRDECARLSADLALEQLHLPASAGAELDADAIEALAAAYDAPVAAGTA
jgi:anion-transporting  ArsA/GET3 family ATPase